jgi:hypothetical protein
VGVELEKLEVTISFGFPSHVYPNPLENIFIYHTSPDFLYLPGSSNIHENIFFMDSLMDSWLKIRL